MLDKKEHYEILKILIKHKTEYTENSNGIFFNLKNLPIPIVNDIALYVRFCLDNRKYHRMNNILKQKYEKELLKNSFKNSITDIQQNQNLTEMYKKYTIVEMPGDLMIEEPEETEDVPVKSKKKNKTNKIS
jgi:hypothetical protein